MRTPNLWVGLATLGVSALGWAQQAQAPPTFRTSTDLVTVDALVTDSHGNAVTGLTADDFRITEKGRLQKISALTFVTTPFVERKEFDPVPLAPMRDVTTNRTAPHSRAYAVVVDDLHLMPFHGERVRRVLTDLLGSIPSTDRVAVIFTGRSDLSVDLTDDRAAQMQAVGRVQDALAFALDLTPVVCGANEAQRRHQALGSLDVLRNVAKILAETRADERTVVYLSEGFNFDFSAMAVDGPPVPVSPATSSPPPGRGKTPPPDQRFCDEHGQSSVKVSNSALPGDPQENVADARQVQRALQEILDAAVRADVRVYTIDPRGNLPVEDDYTGFTPLVQGAALQSKLTVQNDFLRTVAAETGALAAVQRSDLHGAVREVLADTGSYYLLGYTPDPLLRDGLYHQIEVKVARPGLHVRSRKGYQAPDANPKVVTGASALSADLVGGDATADISLAAFVAPLVSVGKLTKTAVTIEVTYPGPATLPASIADDLRYDVVDADVEGKGAVVSHRAFHIALTPARPGDVPFFINDLIDLRPGVANLRVGVLSQATGKVGTVAIPVRIPNLGGDGLEMPSLIVGVEGARASSMPADELAGFVPFQPTLRRTFSADERLRIFAPLSWGGHGDAATVTVSIAGDGAGFTQTQSARATGAATGLRHATVDQVVPLAGLAPGDHVLTMTATLQGGKPVTRTVGFHITAR
jgi:VWFA-related protein